MQCKETRYSNIYFVTRNSVFLLSIVMQIGLGENVCYISETQ